MATVANTLKLSDKMSPVLRQILKAMQMTLSVMGDLDSTAEHTDLSKHFAATTREIAEATAALDAFEQELQNSSREAENTKKKLNEWQQSILAANAAMDIFNKALQVGQKIAGWISEQFEKYAAQETAEVQLAVVMANQGAFEQDYLNILEKASDIQGRSMYSDAALVTGAGELATYLKDAEALSAAMDTLSMYAAGISGGGIVEVGRMLEYATQLGKAFDGQMDGMAKKGFSLSDTQKELLETATDMEKVALITEMIAESWDGLDEHFRLNTASGQIAAFSNDYSNMQERLGQKMELAILYLFETLLQYLPQIEALFSSLATGANIAMYILAGALQFVFAVFREGWPFMLAALMALSVTYLPGIITKLWAMIAPILMQVAAWAAMHAPLLMMIFLLGMLIKSMVDAGVTADDVIGFIGGLFGGLYATVYNIVAEMYNLFIAFAEFFANFLNDPIGSIHRLFHALADFVLGTLQMLASAIDAIFGSSLADSVSNWRSGLAEAVESKFGPAEIQFDRMEQMAVLEGVRGGQKTAQGLMDKIGGLTDVLDSGIGSQLNWGNGGITELDRVGSVGRIDDDINISEEDIKMLRDIAANDYQIASTYLTPSLTANFGDVRETADVDQILGRIVEIGSEEYSSNLAYSR